MSEYWNKRVTGLSPYVPGEQPRDRKFIKLNTNENPYPPSPKVHEAINRVIAEGGGERLRLYPDPACTELREAAALKYGVTPEQVFPGNGSDEILAFVFAALFESAPDGGGTGAAAEALPVLFPDITYSFYPVYAGLWNVPFRTIPLGADFSINGDEYLVPSGGVIFPNPNAPTGRALGLDQIRPILEYQEKQRRVVVVDEAYSAFGAESAVPLVPCSPNLLTVHTLSKYASLAGLRAGFAIGSEELIRGLFRVRDSFNSYTLDRLALAGAAAALLDSGYYDEINRRVIATRERVSLALTGLGFEVVPSRANFVFIRSPRKKAVDLLAALRERGILVRRFTLPRIADYLRVSIGADGDMDTFLEACGKIIKK
ncbi:histidinol-phosphate aminotransferase [Spirochaetia bacterium]|nr:histidinol-phosphate aminotransferase [Spirochaetia bacterium]